MADFDSLNTNQRRAIVALMTEPTIEKAAKKAGLGERTLYRYLGDEAFKAELSKRQDEILAATTAAMASLSEQAVGSLRDVLNRLASQAQGSVGDFVEIDDAGGWTLNLRKAEAAGLLPLIKKLWVDKSGNNRLELHDMQAAAAKLGALALGILAERRKTTELDDLARRVAALEQAQEEK
ncbi:MAG: hypothetical protein JXA14_24655 [Anaerolineae bacterium]|nr:hypothetical protein [Anaerolineae bacterium]